MKKKQKKPQNHSSVNTKVKEHLTMQNLISVGAMIGSLYGAYVTYNTYELANRQFDFALEQHTNENSAVWISKIDTKKEQLSFISNNENITMQQAKIYFPEPFNNSNNGISYPSFELSTEILKMDIKEHLNSKHAREAGAIKVVESHIPFVLETYYVSRGVSYTLKSVYHLHYIATLDENDYDFPQIEITGFWFDQHIGLNDDPDQILKKIWRDGNYVKGYSWETIQD